MPLLGLRFCRCHSRASEVCPELCFLFSLSCPNLVNRVKGHLLFATRREVGTALFRFVRHWRGALQPHSAHRSNTGPSAHASTLSRRSST
jgi:hypothetical protein